MYKVGQRVKVPDIQDYMDNIPGFVGTIVETTVGIDDPTGQCIFVQPDPLYLCHPEVVEFLHNGICEMDLSNTENPLPTILPPFPNYVTWLVYMAHFQATPPTPTEDVDEDRAYFLHNMAEEHCAAMGYDMLTGVDWSAINEHIKAIHNA